MFGLAHFLLYSGDILTRYAVLGLLLLPLYRVPAKVLLACVVLLIGVRGVSRPVIEAVPVLNESVRAPRVPPVQYCRDLTTRYEGRRHVYAQGSARDVLVTNACRFPGEAIGYWFRSGRLAETFAYFIIGLLLGRAGVFRRIGQITPRVGRVTLFGAVIGLSLLGVGPVLPETDGLWSGLTGSLNAGGMLGTTLAYGGAIILLFQRPRWRRLLLPLAAMGRMALTVYLMQTVVYSTMFYGYGLGWDIRAGRLALLVLAAAMYGVEVLLCNLWLRYFRYGPFEWLWRALTYLEIPPLLEVRALKSSRS